MPALPIRIVLVTGAHGFLGRHVAKRFARDGAIVIGVGHGDFFPERPIDWGIAEWRSADVSLPILTALPAKPDLVVHCAGGSLVSRSFDAPREDFERSVSSTSSVLEYLRLHAPDSRLIFPSSAAVYGAASSFPIKTTATAQPLSPYGVHKRAAEDLCRAYSSHFGVRTVILRLFSLYGAGLRKQLLWDGCRRLSDGSTQFGGTGNELRDWLHVDDAAELVVASAEFASIACPVANGGTGIGTRVRDILTVLANTISPGTEIRFAGVGRAGDPTAYVADITEAQAWGWRPRINWQSGVRAYAQWYGECVEGQDVVAIP